MLNNNIFVTYNNKKPIFKPKMELRALQPKATESKASGNFVRSRLGQELNYVNSMPGNPNDYVMIPHQDSYLMQ